jgi:uncharacterized protein (DUF885 family)
VRFRVVSVCLLLVVVAPHASAQDYGSRLRTMIRADAGEAAPQSGGWPDLSPASIAAHADRDRAILADLARLPRAGLREDDRILYDLFRHHVDARLRQLRLRMYLTPFWEDRRFSAGEGSSPWALAPAFEALSAPVLVAELRLQKLRAFPAYVGQIIALMAHGAAEGMLPARSVIAAFAVPGNLEERFLGAFAKLYEPPAEHARIRAEAAALVREQVLPAIREYERFVAQEYAPRCPEAAGISSWPDGAAMFQVLIERNTSIAMTPEEVYALGASEVARIREAMLPVIRALGWQGTLDEFLADARTNPRYYFANENDLLRAYGLAAELIGEIAGQAASGAQPVEITASRAGGIAASYAPEARRVLVDVARLDLRPRFEILPVMLHEGPLGHALERERTKQRRKAADPEERDLAAGTQTAYVEGWGVYAEALGEDLGLYEDPLAKFGELHMQLWRAARAVIDAGIHAYGWSAEQAQRYFQEQTGRAADFARLEVERTARPGFQLSYLIGFKRFEGLRAAAQTALGPQFDLVRFHDALLGWGPLPFDLLREKLDRCLAAGCLTPNETPRSPAGSRRGLQ